MFHDCHDLMKSKPNQTLATGVYEIQPNGSSASVKVKCDEDGWTVIQSRGQFGNPVEYFRRSWDYYEKGFGVPGGN